MHFLPVQPHRNSSYLCSRLFVKKYDDVKWAQIKHPIVIDARNVVDIEDDIEV